MSETENKLSGIDQAIKDGLTLRCYSTGDLLRVASIVDPRNYESKGYGQGFCLEQALIDANFTLLNGNPKFEEVYGPIMNFQYQDQAKTDNLPQSQLDLWLSVLGKFKVTKSADHMVLTRETGDLISLKHKTKKDAYTDIAKLIDEAPKLVEGTSFMILLEITSPESLGILSQLSPTLEMRSDGRLLPIDEALKKPEPSLKPKATRVFNQGYSLLTQKNLASRIF